MIDATGGRRWKDLDLWRRRAEGLRRRPRLLAVLSGIVLALAQPPFCFLPGLLGYAVLMVILEQDLGPKPLRAAYGIGWLAGFPYFLISCFWVADAFLVDAQAYGWMAPFAALLLPAGIALFWGAFALLYRWLLPRLHGHGARFVLFALLFSIFEILRGTVLTGFPWNPAGSTWRAGDAMSQIASIAGVYGLGLVTVMIFASPAAVLRGRGLRGYWPIAAGLALWIGCFVFGEVRLATTPVGWTDVTVRLVQPAIGQKLKWSEGGFEALLKAYVNMTEAPPKPGHRPPDIVIWPEGALPYTADDMFAANAWTAPVLYGMLSDHQSLIMGVSRSDIDATGRQVWRNSMMVMRRDGQQTRIEGYADKYKLVPFGEFMPFAEILNPLGMKALTHMDDSFTAGPRPHPVEFPGIPRFLPLICYEGIFPALSDGYYTRDNDPARPKLIINISNDAWFGVWTGPRQHLNLAAYRAIEEGLPLVRSTPTGISVLVDPMGRVIPNTRLDLGKRAYVDLNIPQPARLTPFSSWLSWLRHGLLWLDLTLSLIIIAFFSFVAHIKNNRQDY